MAIEIFLPKVGFVATEGTILEWLKRPGEPVVKGEPILSFETEKATVEIESPGTGVLGSELASAGTTVAMGTTIGFILEPGEVSPALPIPQAAPALGTGTLPHPQNVRIENDKSLQRVEAGASPAARRLAREHGIDLTSVAGSGPGGRVIEKDVVRFLPASPAQAVRPASRPSPVARRIASAEGVVLTGIEGKGKGGQVTKADVLGRVDRGPASTGVRSEAQGDWVELTGIQKTTAERMALSFRTAPHFYLSVLVDMGAVAALRQELLAAIEIKSGVRISITDILLSAVAHTLPAHRRLNAVIEDGRILELEEINIALAVDTPRGLTVPVIHHADQLTLEQIAETRLSLVEKGRDSKLERRELSDATFTLTNLGMFGVDAFHPILNPPQSAILAVGHVRIQPMVVDERVEPRLGAWLTLAIDHRVADGARGARFLNDLQKLLGDPSELVGGGDMLRRGGLADGRADAPPR